MAFTGNFLCTSFKTELLKGVHNFTATTGNTFNIALYDNSASFTAATTAYTTSNEISGTNYSGGGTHDAYPQDGGAEAPWGINKWNDNKNNDVGKNVTFIKQDNMSVTPSDAGIQLNEGTMTMTGAESISVAPAIVPRQAVPLVLKYFRVKYLIKAY